MIHITNIPYRALFFEAKLRLAQKRLEESLALHLRVLGVRQRTMATHFHTARSLYSTAHVYNLLEDYTKAE